MKAFFSIGLLLTFMTAQASANDLKIENKAETNDAISAQSKAHKRFSFNTYEIHKLGDWQYGNLTTRLYQPIKPESPAQQREFPYRQIRVSDFSVVGLRRSQVREALGNPSSPLISSRKEEVKNDGELEDFRVSQPGNCTSAGVVWLQLAYVNDRVRAYRYCSFALR